MSEAILLGLKVVCVGCAVAFAMGVVAVVWREIAHDIKSMQVIDAINAATRDMLEAQRKQEDSRPFVQIKVEVQP